MPPSGGGEENGENTESLARRLTQPHFISSSFIPLSYGLIFFFPHFCTKRPHEDLQQQSQPRDSTRPVSRDLPDSPAPHVRDTFPTSPERTKLEI